MALREVLQFPDPRLRRKAKPVREITPELRQLAKDMIDVMYDEPGIGLAAPQVGESRRIIVMDTEWRNESEEGAAVARAPKVMVNPEITAHSGRVTWTEACLSVPDFQADVKRHANVTVRYTDLEGRAHEEQAQELRAVCFQHEIDHLNGVLFIDRISALKRDLYAKKRRKALRAAKQT